MTTDMREELDALSDSAPGAAFNDANRLITLTDIEFKPDKILGALGDEFVRPEQWIQIGSLTI